MTGWLFRTRRERARCFHHDHRTGVTWIQWELIDAGRAKLYECIRCGKVWII